MHVTAIQLDITWEDKPANFAKVRRMAALAAPPAGGLVVLPEMFATGFSMNVPGLAEPAGGPAQTFLADLARERGVHVIGGVATLGPDGRGRNEAVVYAPDGCEQARYAKMHLFSYGGETGCFTPGDRVVTCRIGEFTAAPTVCYDLRFPELYRAAVRAGADLLVIIANWPAAREAHWTALLAARAIENQAYVVGVNRCGSSPQHAYSGGSRIIDPCGNILADAGDGEGCIAATLDREALQTWRRKFPALADIRPDLAGG